MPGQVDIIALAVLIGLAAPDVVRIKGITFAAGAGAGCGRRRCSGLAREFVHARRGGLVAHEAHRYVKPAQAGCAGGNPFCQAVVVGVVNSLCASLTNSAITPITNLL